MLVKPAAPPVVPVTGTSPRAGNQRSGPVPDRLEVDSVDISMPVVPVGVDQNGDMGLPASVGEVGWYEFGARPTDSRGTTVLAAHVDSRRDGLGPFARLREVRSGDTISLTTSGRRTIRYRVDRVDRISKKTVPLADVFEREGAPRLVLITCGGAYDRGTGYRDNVVVTALPQSGRS
ncbi:MAG: class F sortase [Propionibacteriaceae bacterium]